MKKLLLIVMLLVLVATLAPAEIFLDAFSWQPYQPAFNLMPVAGCTFVVFGLLNVGQGHTAAGLIQFFLGVGLVAVGFIAPKI